MMRVRSNVSQHHEKVLTCESTLWRCLLKFHHTVPHVVVYVINLLYFRICVSLLLKLNVESVQDWSMVADLESH